MRTVKLQDKISQKVFFIVTVTLFLLAPVATVVSAQFNNTTTGGCSGACGKVSHKYYKLSTSGAKTISSVYSIGDTISIEPNPVSFGVSSIGHTVLWNIMVGTFSDGFGGTQTYDSLPLGLSFDSATGIISGTLQKPPQPLTKTDYSFGVGVSLINAYGIADEIQTGGIAFTIKVRPCGPYISAPKLDPAYVADTIAFRHFVPKLPITPFDNIIVDIDMDGCPATDLYIPSITTTESSGLPVTVLMGNAFSRGGNSDPITGIYKWAISGWPFGIRYYFTGNLGKLDPLMETLVDAIVQKRPVNIVVTKQVPVGGSPMILKKQITMSRCVRIYGNGPNGVTFLRERSSGLGLWPMVVTTRANVDGLNSKAPFNAIITGTKSSLYSDKFSHTVDLREYDEPKWTLKAGIFGNLAGTDMLSFLVGTPTGTKDCATSKNEVLVGVASFDQSVGSQAVALDKRILIDVADFNTSKTDTFVHEFGHAFAGLRDEYIVGNNPYVYLFHPGNRNCSSAPSLDFSYQNISYSFAPRQGCTTSLFYRPALTSIMQDVFIKNPQFNVISCGWILKKINGGLLKSGKDFFPECSKMTGLVP